MGANDANKPSDTGTESSTDGRGASTDKGAGEGARPGRSQQQAIARRLKTANFEIEGRMPYSSNGTFLVTLLDHAEAPAATSGADETGSGSGNAGQKAGDSAAADRARTAGDTDRDKIGANPATASDDDKSSSSRSAGSDNDNAAETDTSGQPESSASESDDYDQYFEDDEYYEDEYYDEDDEPGETREVDLEDGRLRAIYKPLRTERPLWDFPEGLYRREVATYEMSAWLGWDIIPTTVEVDGPLGPGSVQRFIQADFSKHYFNHLDDEALHPQLQTLCALDLLTNQTDRKGGHCLIDADNHIWGIDNGLSFHAESKVRTVIWDFAGQPIADDLLEDLARLVDQGVPDSVGDLLDDNFERDALLQRARALIDAKVFPYDHTGRRYPWPMI